MIEIIIFFIFMSLHQSTGSYCRYHDVGTMTLVLVLQGSKLTVASSKFAT